METDLSKRLKFFCKFTKKRITEIANEVGIPKENLYKWKRGHKPSNINLYTKLTEYLDRMEKELNVSIPVAPVHEHATNIPATIRLPLDPNKPYTYQNFGVAAAGTLVASDNNLELIVDRIDAPFLGIIEGALEVEEDSMEPTFKNGCRVAIFRLRYPRLLNWGTCYYLVDKNQNGIVRRVYEESTEVLKLISDNRDQVKYPPIFRHWDDILAIFKVKAAIQKL